MISGDQTALLSSSVTKDVQPIAILILGFHAYQNSETIIICAVTQNQKTTVLYCIKRGSFIIYLLC